MAARVVSAEEVGLLWLAALQRAMGRASHDVKDSLNGVSVNLEVIRSRAARPEAPASAVAPFAEAAGQQLERLTSLIEAVLALGKPERDPADVALTLRRVAVVCSASSSSADAAVELREAADGVGAGTVTRVRGDVVRLALIAPLLEAVAGIDRSSRASAVQCTVGGTESHVLVTIGAPGRRSSMPGAVADAVRAGGVTWTEGTTARSTDGSQDLSLAFPRA
jgi:signal transduction histidine kinase